MSFSWSVEDENGKDLLEEFDINYQMLGLAGDQSENSTVDLRSAFINSAHYADKFPPAARGAIEAVQCRVARNLWEYEGHRHPECPSCRCVKPIPKDGMDHEQAKRFVSIPLERVHKASGGY